MEAFELLEHEFGVWIGFRPEQVCACSSGTSALHLALEALRLPQGSEVIVPTMTMIACARAVTLAGLVPVFVDCTDDLLMDLDCVDAACAGGGGSVRAVMAVHIYGRRVAMNQLHALARKYALPVVEDLAEAHGVAPHPDTAAACYSFYKNKIIFSEEGGAVAFRDTGHAALARSLRCLGFGPEHSFVHLPRGANYRLANLLARPIIESIRSAHKNLAARRGIESVYDAACPLEWRMPKRDVVWCYDVRVPGMTRETQAKLVKALNAEGIAARHSFWPMSAQEEYRGCRAVGGEVAARMAQEVFYLPATPGQVTEASARRSFEVVCEVAAPNRRASISCE